MNKKMSYKGYIARIEYSDEDGCLVGHIAGINDIVGFHGDSISELRTAFEEAVDDYLETCKKIGKTPQKSYSGHLMLRIPPELHAKVAMLAAADGKSLNSWVTELLSKDRSSALIRRGKKTTHQQKENPSSADL